MKGGRTHMNNKQFYALSILLLLLTSISIITAQETTTTENTDRELTTEEEQELQPIEAPRTGALGRYFERVGLWWTFNDEKRIEKALELAEKRLADAESYAEENPELAEHLRERYENFIGQAEEALTNLEEEATTDEEALPAFIRARERTDMLAYKTRVRYENALQRIEETGNEQTREKIEALYNKANDRINNTTQKLERIEERIKERRATAEGLTEEEIEQRIEQVRNNEGIREKYEARMIHTDKRVTQFEQLRERDLQRLRERINDTNITEEEREQLQQRINEMQQRVEKYRMQAYDVIERKYEARRDSEGALTEVRLREKVKQRLQEDDDEEDDMYEDDDSLEDEDDNSNRRTEN